LVEAFVKREIDLAWNAPLAYVKIKRRLQNPCQVVAMRDVDVNFTTRLFPMLARVLVRFKTSKASGSPLAVEGRFRPGYYRTISYSSWDSIRHMIWPSVASVKSARPVPIGTSAMS
jgi:hypothetical protein